MTNAQVVYRQLQDDFPKQDCKWVLNSDVKWSTLTSVPMNSIDFSNTANWNATGHTAKIKRFEEKLRRGDKKPVILARIAGQPKLVVLDGHHRVLASKNMSMPVKAYICTITGSSKEAALEMHAEQRHGNSGEPVTSKDPIKLTNAYNCMRAILDM